MRIAIISATVLVLLSGAASAAEKPLWDKLVDVVIQHIKTNGPDAETGQFMSMARHHAWSRRQEFVSLVVPYLKRALVEAESPMIRQRTAYELVLLRVPEGFRYLQQLTLANPDPEERTRPRPLDRIRQFAIDRLGLPRDTREAAAIAAHIRKKERELCRTQDSGKQDAEQDKSSVRRKPRR